MASDAENMTIMNDATIVISQFHVLVVNYGISNTIVLEIP